MATEIENPKDREPNVENPNKTLETVPNKPSLTVEHQKKAEESKESESRGADAPLDSSVSDSAPVTHLQKKIRRAERFGMTVQLSEEERRNNRAERFGTGPTSHGSEGSKTSEEQKRKARAERFGLPAQSVVDEEAKKKARLARFAPVSKTNPVEEEKKKARAIRFSQTPSQVNGKANSEKEMATIINAGGVI